MKKVLVLSDGRKVPYEVFVTESRGKVTAVAKGCEMLGIDGCRSAFRSVECLSLEDGCKLYDDMLMQHSYSGVAVCRLNDEFDPAVGEELAVKKLTKKLDAAVQGRKRMLAKELVSMARSLDGMDSESLRFVTCAPA